MNRAVEQSTASTSEAARKSKGCDKFFFIILRSYSMGDLRIVIHELLRTRNALIENCFLPRED